MARDFFPRLAGFGESLGPSCPKIKRAIEYVTGEATSAGALTIDDLARIALLRRGGGTEDYRKAWRTVSLARIVTDAFFLHLESDIPRIGLGPMQNLWHEILGNATDDLPYRFPDTRYRLVTFNYDRVVEITFERFFTHSLTKQYDIYSSEVLNAGLNSREGPIFKADRFCFLKLHGTVGVYPFGPNEIDRGFGHFFAHYAPFSQSASSINDGTYFKDQDDGEGLPLWKFLPLIVFPADRQRVEGGGEDYNLKEYIQAIRDKAAGVFAAANQIRVIGYSFHPADKLWLVSLLRSAPETKKIIINPHAGEICEELRVQDDLQNLHPQQRTWGSR